MFPYLVQGANSATEDGSVLGLKQQLPQALKIYERLRKARGETIAKESFKQVRTLLAGETFCGIRARKADRVCVARSAPSPRWAATGG
jgi:hypothetical protein